MTSTWTDWQNFPDPRSGGRLDAPIGPGVYEVRDNTTNAMVAFGSSSSVARDLSKLLPGAPRSLFGGLFSKMPSVPLENLEYRTWAAATLADAHGNAARLRGRREVYMRRRSAAWGVA